MRTLALMIAGLGLVVSYGCGCTPVEGEFYTSRPLITWTLTAGGTCEVECWDYFTGEPVTYIEAYRQGEWRPEEDLEFEHTYRMEVVDNTSGENVLCAVFDVTYEIPTLISPLDEQEVWSVEPELRWEVAVHPWPEARYTVQISRRDDFREIYWQREDIGGPGAEMHFIGVDQIDGTEDDIDFVSIECDKPLDPEREYFWRVRTDYFKGERKLESGPWSKGRRFFVPPQPTGEVLQDMVPLTSEETQDKHPDVSAAYDLAYESWTEDISQIQIKRGKRHVNRIEFDPGIERFSLGDSIDRQPDWDSSGEGIAFSSNRGGNIYRVWHKKAGAGGHLQITSTNQLDAVTPEYSPDGTKIAYSERDKSGTPWIWVIDADGTKPTKITEGFQPAWSHDGGKIAYVLENRAGGLREELNHLNIWVWDEETNTNTQLTYSFSNLYPTWSLDDRMIAFSSNRSGNWDIWEMESAGGEKLRQLTNYLGTDTQPVWTPHEEHLVYSSTRDTKKYNIWMGRVPPP